MARRFRRGPREPYQQAPQLGVRAPARALGDGLSLVAPCAGGLPRRFALAQLGDARRRRRGRLLLRTLPGAGRGGAARLPRAARPDPLARAAPLAAVAHLARHLRRGVDRAVLRPRGRGQAPVLLQGCAVSADRAALAPRRGVPPFRPAGLARVGRPWGPP